MSPNQVASVDATEYLARQLRTVQQLHLALWLFGHAAWAFLPNLLDLQDFRLR